MTEKEELKRWRKVGMSLGEAFPAGDYHLSKKQNLALNEAIDLQALVENGTAEISPMPKDKEIFHVSTLERDFLRRHGFSRIGSPEEPNTWTSTVKGFKNVTFPHDRIFNVIVAVLGGGILARAKRIWIDVEKQYGDWDASFNVLCSLGNPEKPLVDKTVHLKSDCGSEDLHDAIMLAIALFKADELYDSFGIQDEVDDEEDDEEGGESAPNDGFPTNPSRIYAPYPCYIPQKEEKNGRFPPCWTEPPKWGDPPGWWENQPTCYDRTITVSAKNSTNK